MKLSSLSKTERLILAEIIELSEPTDTGLKICTTFQSTLWVYVMDVWGNQEDFYSSIMSLVVKGILTRTRCSSPFEEDFLLEITNLGMDLLQEAF